MGNQKNIGEFIEFTKSMYATENVLLHRPVFAGNEKNYLNECIDSNFVSSVGKKVDTFEKMICEFTGAKHAIATVNGTAALHVALQLAGVVPGSDVITQSMSFVATANAINYCGATPVFLDCDINNLGLAARCLEQWLGENVERESDRSINRKNGRPIAACVPMHTFGHPCEIREITEIAQHYHIPVVEDAAESLGSYVQSRHTGTFGLLGTFSFNGNKIITTGGGGMIVTNDADLARRAKHITTTAKEPHSWEYSHDMVAYNYRLPNLNAALGCAQMEQLPQFIAEKRKISQRYADFFKTIDVPFIIEPSGTSSNYWLNAIKLKSLEERDEFLALTNKAGVMTRPVWRKLNTLNAYKASETGDLSVSTELERQLVNIPSSVIA